MNEIEYFHCFQAPTYIVHLRHHTTCPGNGIFINTIDIDDDHANKHITILAMESMLKVSLSIPFSFYLGVRIKIIIMMNIY